MEREETEEKESVRKTEKERHEMKYKVGDKVRVRKDLKVSKEYDGMIFNDVMSQHCGETVTINEVFSRGYYRIVEYGCCWTDGMFEGLADEELTAEEALKTYAEICSTYHFCDGCPIGDGDVKDHKECNTLLSEYTEDTLQRLKQWKKDHEKKEVETEITWCVLIIEADTHTLKHEEEVGTDFKSTDAQKAEILKKYCSEHDGKYYAISERRCVVKE